MTVSPPSVPPPLAEPPGERPTDRLRLSAAAVEGLLEPTTLEVRRGEIVVAVGRPGPSNVALALVAAGRLALTGGAVALNGDAEPRVRQRSVVLVDVPGVTEPDDAVPFRVIVGEELALSGLPSGPGAATAWLRANGLPTRIAMRTEEVAASERLRMLTELGAARAGTSFLVVVSPDRHGLHHREWLPILSAVAAADCGVLVTVSDAVDLSGTRLSTVPIGNARHAEVLA